MVDHIEVMTFERIFFNLDGGGSVCDSMIFFEINFFIKGQLFRGGGVIKITRFEIFTLTTFRF